MATRRQNIKIVFLDSSAMFSAVCSPTGGSSKLFTLTDLRLTTSLLVLVEVEKNVRKKLAPYHLERFFLLSSQLLVHKDIPEAGLLKKAGKAIVEKDAVILASAKKTKSNYLITLDKKHFFTEKAKKFVRPTKILLPKDLIKICGGIEWVK